MNANQPRQRCVFSLRFCSANLPDLNGSTERPRHIRGGEWKWCAKSPPEILFRTALGFFQLDCCFLGNWTEGGEGSVMEFCEFNWKSGGIRREDRRGRGLAFTSNNFIEYFSSIFQNYLFFDISYRRVTAHITGEWSTNWGILQCELNVECYIAK